MSEASAGGLESVDGFSFGGSFGGFTVVDDLLDRMAPEATDLLRRVDLVIDQLGVPERHPVTESLRRLRVRPNDALQALLSTSPSALRAAADELRRLAAVYRDEIAEPLREAVQHLGWGGSGYRAFTDAWTTLQDHLAAPKDSGVESMATKLIATAEYALSIAGWFSQARQALAGALAEALCSAEAVTLKTSDVLTAGPAALHRAVISGELDHPGRLVAAAAEIGGVTLSALEECYQAGLEHFVAGPDGSASSWPAKLAELPPPKLPDSAATSEVVWLRL